VPAQLAPPLAALPSAILRGEREVPGISPLLAEVVAADFAMDGGAVPAELSGDGSDRHLGVQQAENRAPLVEIELVVGRPNRNSEMQTSEKPTESHFALETTRLHASSASIRRADAA